MRTPPTHQEILEYAVMIGVPKEFAGKLASEMLNGMSYTQWPHNWQLLLKSKWESQRHNFRPGQPELVTGMDKMIALREYDEITAKLEAIERCAAEDAMGTRYYGDQADYRRDLKARRTELKALLGMRF